jgi:hypothetical protein
MSTKAPPTLSLRNEWVGTVGKRQTFLALRVFLRTVHDQNVFRGVIYTYTLLSPDGNVITWRSAKDFPINTIFSADARVIAHRRLYGLRVTVIT